MRNRGFQCCVVFAAMVLSFASPTFAQTALSEITGEVVDATGAVIADVQISLTNTATGVTTSLLTNEVGRFYGRAIPPGSYNIEAGKPGFKTFRATSVEFRTGQVLRFDIPMEVGDVATTIEVSGQAGDVEIQRDTAEISTVISQQVVQELPKVTRRTLELLAITPAVTMAEKGGWYTIYVPFFSTAGNPGTRSSMFYADGTSTVFARAQGDGGGMANLNPPPEVVSELRVIYNNYSAEFGEGIGAVILMTTKSGTNEFKGNTYYFNQNEALEARNFFARRKNVNRFNNFGGTLGGPIVKDRTHFFVSLEGERWLQKSPLLVTLPTLRQRQGDFSQTFDNAGNLIPIYDPATTGTEASRVSRGVFPDNRIPAARFDPIGSRILNNYVIDPNQPGSITGANNFRADPKGKDFSHFWQHYRLDHQQTANNRFYFRYSRDYLNIPIEGPFKGSKAEVADPYGRDWWQFGVTVGATWTSIISPTTVSDLRFGYTNFVNNNCAPCGNAQVWQQDWARQLGLKNLGADGFPRLELGGYGDIGVGLPLQLIYDTMRSWSFYETISHQRGKHNLRVGGGWKHSKAVYAGRLFPSGVARFDPRATALPGVAGTGNSVASALLGEVASARVLDTPASDMRTWFATVFFQDDWRVTKNLALNLGVRYEYDRPKVDVTEGTNFFNSDKINPVSGTPGVVEFGINKWTVSQKHTPLYYQPPSQFAPRLGFAWTPLSRQDLVMRGGYGIFYTGGDYGDQFWDGPLLGRAISQDWVSDGLGTIPAFRFSEGFPAIPVEALTDAFGAVRVGASPRVAPSFFWVDRKAGYAQQFNLGIQKKIGLHLIEVGYLGNAVKKLPNHAELNEVRPELRGPGNAQVLRPFPQFGTVRAFGMNRARSLYHAGFISIRRNFSQGLTFGGSYTFARHLADTSPRSSYDLKSNYGPLGIERRHRFVWHAVYELPFGKGKAFLNSIAALDKIFGGWSISNFIEFRSGAPYSINSIANTCNCFSQGNQGVDLIGNPKKDTSGLDPFSDTWFNISAFAPAQPYRFGNAGSGILEAPGYSTVDITLAKRVPFNERISLDVRADVFNMFNTVNLNQPGNLFGSPSFGRITSAGSFLGGGPSTDARKVQLGAKLYF